MPQYASRNKGRGTWQYFTLTIIYSAYFKQKHSDDTDGRNDPLDMDITSGCQGNYNQFSSSQRLIHLIDIKTFIFMIIFIQG